MNIDHTMTLSEGVPYCKIQYSIEPKIECMPSITSANDTYRFLMEVWDKGSICYKEEFVVILLNHAKKVLGWAKISSGSSSATIVSPSMVFQVALLSHSDSVILAHNHPSGGLKPSNADIVLTRRLKEAGKLLGIGVLDHLIITKDSYSSFLELGIL